ncbi:hypothetical protein HOY80DRAFT_426538 [Tuber brumale]|nr:hypothetical protein HOY80DRAFT_426538 [Tuber brumale]
MHCNTNASSFNRNTQSSCPAQYRYSSTGMPTTITDTVLELIYSSNSGVMQSLVYPHTGEPHQRVQQPFVFLLCNPLEPDAATKNHFHHADSPDRQPCSSRLDCRLGEDTGTLWLSSLLECASTTRSFHHGRWMVTVERVDVGDGINPSPRQANSQCTVQAQHKARSANSNMKHKNWTYSLQLPLSIHRMLGKGKERERKNGK